MNYCLVIIFIFNSKHQHTSSHCISSKFALSEEGRCCDINNQAVMTSTPYAACISQPIMG